MKPKSDSALGSGNGWGRVRVHHEGIVFQRTGIYWGAPAHVGLHRCVQNEGEGSVHDGRSFSSENPGHFAEISSKYFLKIIIYVIN